MLLPHLRLLAPYMLIVALILGIGWAWRVAIVTDRARKAQAKLAPSEPPLDPTFGPWFEHARTCKCNVCR